MNMDDRAAHIHWVFPYSLGFIDMGVPHLVIVQRPDFSLIALQHQCL
ncbi:MAG: hypothetical protein AAGA75_18750 [Cyanobacteria bacterium P01_E01_bin.6]